MHRHRPSLVLTLLPLAPLLACGAPQETTPPVDMSHCQYTTMRPRFCGASEDEALWREDNPGSVRVCNGCFTDEECRDRPGGRCVELPGEGCAYSAFVCVYPGDPCADPEGGGCEGTCVNRDGRAACGAGEG